MTMNSIAKNFAFAVATVTTLLSTAAWAEYPDRVITMVVPFAAGGAADVTGRIIADALSKRLGQTVIVENVAGAGGTTGTARSASSDGDGYHMGTHAAAMGLYPKLAYDPRTSFKPLGLVTRSPIIVFARKDLPANTLAEFLDYARAHPGEYTDGHSGAGSISHITCALFESVGKFKATLVPYRGVGPMMNDMLGGNVDYSCDLVVAVSSQIRGGALKGFAVAAKERSKAVPDVPTTAEAGLPDFQADTWTGLFVPVSTPDDIARKLESAISASLADPAVAKRLEDLGAEVPKADERGGAYLGTLVASEITRWSDVIKTAGIKVSQ
ncbi:Bug family tripartite tricarboxylate transporter substrate binding protein [Rhizobium leguminosarum]|uniref:Bug family tripartite tricarboxylate transporter substrate binding protein n=1 Tax=Rhizobium leguminosarum TaxID=384 RepID=UPI0013C1CF4B|nr:tripartite tricarboxylate transporter substrate-binding protein [Rhizobium leguminosarum]NEI03056.1 tripartite tricarboxylate transporter substrate binding protein BugD [Rhizobium leguminosarum]NEJ47474.1 tripartite tricarboxylate transporter substrate binding protein BugD [Rhizobium leguminosarum]NEJ54423.1 tripartite tricarboxylate transporter substrate binding protein BugD [Rhizobium leguminosarum]NEJ82119.1 tripartite tricarboxylate transporter substrate binding protein BugD [Rhizobium l